MAADPARLPPDEPPVGVIEGPVDSALSKGYLVYARSTIAARSLPEVRDGLKPVQRRLLWAVRLLRLDRAAAVVALFAQGACAWWWWGGCGPDGVMVDFLHVPCSCVGRWW